MFNHLGNYFGRRIIIILTRFRVNNNEILDKKFKLRKNYFILF
jgi:hypothetical protein